MIGKIHIVEAAAIDLDQSQVALLVGAQDLGGVDFSVVGRDRDGLGMVDDVVIGDRVAVGGDEEAGAFTGYRPALRLPVELAPLAKVLAELLEELFHGGAGLQRAAVLLAVLLIVGVVLHILLDLHAHGNDRRFHLGDQIRKVRRLVDGFGGLRGSYRGSICCGKRVFQGTHQYAGKHRRRTHQHDATQRKAPVPPWVR